MFRPQKMLPEYRYCIANDILWRFSELRRWYWNSDVTLRIINFGGLQTSEDDTGIWMLYCECYTLEVFRPQKKIPEYTIYIIDNWLWRYSDLRRSYQNTKCTLRIIYVGRLPDLRTLYRNIDFTLRIIHFGGFLTSEDDTGKLILHCE